MKRRSTASRAVLMVVFAACWGCATTNGFSQSLGVDAFRPVPGGVFPINNTNSAAVDVTISPFLISRFEVTQAEYQAIMGSNPSTFSIGAESANRPVENVSWYDVIVFCNTVSLLEGLTPVYRIGGSTNPADWGPVPTVSDATWNAATMDLNADGYRLPTAVEWEVAARGGDPNAPDWDYRYAGSDFIDEVAWEIINSNRRTQPVGLKNANRLGLYDMSGNAWEWTWDWNALRGYPSSQTDPTGPATGWFRVLRGGGYSSIGFGMDVTERNEGYPPDRHHSVGFRLVRTIVQ